MGITIKLYVFAYLRDLFEVSRETDISLDKSEWISSDELKCKLLDILWKKRHNSIDPSCVSPVSPDTIMLAVNEEFVDPGVEIKLIQNDVVALIPPVSGG